MPLSICVYSSSSDHLDAVYYETARELAHLMAARRHTLVYGGGNNGLMGAMATEMQRTGGGRIVGVIPIALKEAGYCLETIDEVIVTDGMRDRKAVMDERADAFVALPGGFGTLEEIIEMLTWRQLGIGDKPCAFLDVAGYWSPIAQMMDRMVADRFLHPDQRQDLWIGDDIGEMLGWMRAYEPVQATKWLNEKRGKSLRRDALGGARWARPRAATIAGTATRRSAWRAARS